MSDFGLRNWINFLESKGRLKSVRNKVKLQWEVAAISKKFDGEKAVLFESTNGPKVPIISNIVCNRDWYSEKLGINPRDLLKELLVRHGKRIDPKLESNAPFLERTIEEIKITDILPVPTYHEYDAGPYITAGVFFAHDPETGTRNVSIHRMQVIDKNKFGLLILPRHLKSILNRSKKSKTPLKVAVTVGLDPILLLASQLVLSPDEDEIKVAGAIKGDPISLTPAPWSGIPVPTDSEIVIEGEILPNEKHEEGPFGEFPRYYGPSGKREVLNVHSISMREDAIYYSVLPAGFDHLLMGSIPREVSLLNDLKKINPSVLDVSLPLSSSGRFHCNVQIEKQNEGETKNVLMAALSSHYDIKHVTIVDHDINIHDLQQVDWAIATRFQAHKDLFVIEGVLGSKLDPSANNGITSKMGLDATAPLGSLDKEFRTIKIPGYVSSQEQD